MNISRRTLIWVCLFCALGYSEQLSIMTGKGTNADGVSVRFDTRLETIDSPPRARVFPAQEHAFGGGIIVSDETFHRFFVNRSARTYFGYDLTVEAAGSGAARLNILPLSIGAERMHLDSPGAWIGLALPRYPPPQTVRSGDTLALDLMVNRLAGQKIVDYLTIEGRPLGKLKTVAAARDFTLEDVEMSLQHPRIRFDVQSTETTAGLGGSVSGRFVWIYLAQHGRFVFSVAPRAELGFRKAGKLHGRALSFEWSGNIYEVDCRAPIIPGSGTYNLYVFHDPGYQPRGSDREAKVQMGAADNFPVGP